MVLEIKIASVKSITNNALCGGLKLLFDCDSISKSTQAESVYEYDIRRRSVRKIIHELIMYVFRKTFEFNDNKFSNSYCESIRATTS
jgi:hypothetical protein